MCPLTSGSGDVVFFKQSSSISRLGSLESTSNLRQCFKTAGTEGNVHEQRRFRNTERAYGSRETERKSMFTSLSVSINCT